MRLFLVLTLLLVGCRQQNSGYCLGADCPTDAPLPCTVSDDTCVCFNMICVECTNDDERNCGGTQPQCGSDNRCRECRSNDDCPSGACLENGACASMGQVIYAAPTGVAMSGCGKEPGKMECTLPQALMEVNSPRDVIRLAPGMYTVTGLSGLNFSDISATVVARGAIIRNVTGALMTVTNSNTLKIIGGTLTGPNGADGLRCGLGGKLQVHEAIIENMTESGIETDSCELTVSRSKIRGNLRGGINMINVAKIATITNNFVYGNGQGNMSPIGGMGLKLVAGSRVEFNTVVDNFSNTLPTSAGGILCDGQGYNAPFNIIYRNRGGTDRYQVNGTCTFIGTYQRPAMSDTENAVEFERPNEADPSYRLTEASPAEVRDVADCTGIDFEGDPRPLPSADMEGKCDYGADEFRKEQ